MHYGENHMENADSKRVMFLGYECKLQFGKYGNGRTAIELVDAHNGEPIATATLNMPRVPLAENQVFIKDYSENEGMLAALEAAGVVRAMGVHVPSGFASLPVCELLVTPPEQEKRSVLGYPIAQEQTDAQNRERDSSRGR